MVNAILTYRFLPWLRRGLAEAIGPSDNQSRAPRVQLPVSLSVNTSQVNVAAHLYGPGDVVGLDPNQIVRTEPKPLSSDFEPNYFPFIEFVEPTLPWLFTPLSSRGTEQLTPWLCLVVVSEGEGVTYSPTAGNQIATLTVADPKRHLPDLAESWAWAHTQVIWVAGADPEQLLQGAGHQ